MPRIRIRTPGGERIVGTPNCSSLTIRLVAHAQRHTLQLRADAELIGQDGVIEHWSWEFPELPDRASIQFVSEPDSSPGARYDPPDASYVPTVAVPPKASGQSIDEIEAVERELQALQVQMRAYLGSAGRAIQVTTHANPRSLSRYCSFCGKSEEEVQRLVAGPGVFICGECIQTANELISS